MVSQKKSVFLSRFSYYFNSNFSNKQTMQLRISTVFIHAYLGKISIYIQVYKHAKNQTRSCQTADSPRGFRPLSAGNISVAIISVIRRLIVPDRSSIYERAARFLFYSILIWAMDKTLTDTAVLLRVRFLPTAQSRVDARIKGSA